MNFVYNTTRSHDIRAFGSINAIEISRMGRLFKQDFIAWFNDDTSPENKQQMI